MSTELRSNAIRIQASQRCTVFLKATGIKHHTRLSHHGLPNHPPSQLRSLYAIKSQIHLHLPNNFETVLQICSEPSLRSHQNAFEATFVSTLGSPFDQQRSGSAAAMSGSRDEDHEV
jgi:hypothetical protein